MNQLARYRLGGLAPLAEKISDLLNLVERGFGPFFDLIVRLWLAKIFLQSGFVKLGNFDSTIELYTSEHPIPYLDTTTSAFLGTGAEVLGGLLLIVGLFTRLAALPLILHTLALHYLYVEFEDHLYWAILLGWMIVRGPGSFSLDAMIRPNLTRLALPLAAFFDRTAIVLEKVAAPVLELGLRLKLAEIFWQSGITKIANFEQTIFLFEEEYRTPFVPAEFAAYGATATELGASFLLAFGLFGRLASIPLIVLTLVIQLTYLQLDEHYLWMLSLGIFVIYGPGKISIDHLVRQYLMPGLFPSLEPKPEWLKEAPRVVVVGGGFGGVAVAKGLKHARANVTLIDRRNYFLFQPLLYQVATASLSPSDVAVPIRSLFKDQPNTRVIMGRVTAVDKVNRQVQVGEQSIPYDYLVLATGARHSYFGRDEWEKFAPGLKKIDDGTTIRRRILSAFEKAETAAYDDKPKHLTFVIVGGGPTGVELAGAIAEIAYHTLPGEFRNARPESAKVILLDAGPRVLAAMPESLSAKAKEQLERLGVEVRCGQRVEMIDDEGVVLNGERLPTYSVIWAAGVIASSAGKWVKAERDRSDRIIVDQNCLVKGEDRIFALGDTSAYVEAGTGKQLPGVAPVAKQQGAYVAKFLRAKIEGRNAPKAFRYINYGNMATIGRSSAVADFNGLKVSGAIAWWLWGIAHVLFLSDAWSKTSVLVNWFWSYLTNNRKIRLITGENT